MLSKFKKGENDDWRKKQIEIYKKKLEELPEHHINAQKSLILAINALEGFGVDEEEIIKKLNMIDAKISRLLREIKEK